MRRDKLFDIKSRNAKINNRRFFKREFKVKNNKLLIDYFRPFCVILPCYSRHFTYIYWRNPALAFEKINNFLYNITLWRILKVSKKLKMN